MLGNSKKSECERETKEGKGMVNVECMQQFCGNKINIAPKQSKSFSIFIFARAIVLCANRFSVCFSFSVHFFPSKFCDQHELFLSFLKCHLNASSLETTPRIII
jgi:hypothetical protein